MRIIAILLAFTALSSCSRIPLSQWSNSITEVENELIKQKKEANQVAAPDVFLFNGVYNATKKKDAKPYPVIKKLADGLKNDNNILSQQTDSSLAEIAVFKTKHGENPINKIGPEWTDYAALLANLNSQSSKNKVSILNIHHADQVFDSICYTYKIKGVPLLEYEAELASIITELEDEFVALQNQYQAFKREITEKEDRDASMRAIGEMKQKIRQIESELHQMSNLYSRINSLRSDAMLFEGPFIDKTPEVKFIEDKTKSVQQLLKQLSKMESDYENL